MPLIGAVLAADRTAEQLAKDLTNRLQEYYNEPQITVTPTIVNSKLEDLRAAPRFVERAPTPRGQRAHE